MADDEAVARNLLLWDELPAHDFLTWNVASGQYTCNRASRVEDRIGWRVKVKKVRPGKTKSRGRKVDDDVQINKRRSDFACKSALVVCCS